MEINKTKTPLYQVIDTGVEEGTSPDIYDCNSTNEVQKKISEIYLESDVVFGEMLSSIQIVGMSIPDIVELYAEMMKEYEGDRLIQVYGDHGSEAFWNEVEKGEDDSDLIIL